MMQRRRCYSSKISYHSSDNIENDVMAFIIRNYLGKYCEKNAPTYYTLQGTLILECQIVNNNSVLNCKKLLKANSHAVNFSGPIGITWSTIEIILYILLI